MEKRDSQKISDIVNNTSFNPMVVGVELTRDHRYLVEQTFKMFLHFASQLSRDYDNGIYDARNENACKCCKQMIQALEEQLLINVSFLHNEYDKIIQKRFE